MVRAEASPEAQSLRAGMDLNERQGRLLISQGRSSREEVSAAWAEARARGLDVCAVLIARGRIDPATADAIRRAATAEVAGPGPADPHENERPTTRYDGAGVASGFASSPQAMAAAGVSGELAFPSGSVEMPMSSTVAGSRDGSHSLEISAESVTIPGYVIEKELGRGGMGVVLLGLSVKDDSRVVIKVMNRRDPGEELTMRFLREARALAQLSHPNIVRVRDLSRHDGIPYFVMDFVEGRDLKSIVRETLRTTGEAPDPEWTAALFGALADALATCHEAGIIHRDIKPENILVEEGTDRPMLVDFGLARLETEDLRRDLDEGVMNLTRTGQVVGTPAYMPPEQLDPEGGYGEVGTSSDVWGFGATLYFALSGESPYKGATIANIFKALVTSDPEPVSAHNAEVPEWLEQITADCLQRDNTLRPTMRELASELGGGDPERLRAARRRVQVLAATALGVVFVLALGLTHVIWGRVRPVIEVVERGCVVIESDSAERDFSVVTRDKTLRLELSVKGNSRLAAVLVGGLRYPVRDERVTIVCEDLDASPRRLALRGEFVMAGSRPIGSVVVRRDAAEPELTLESVRVAVTDGVAKIVVAGRVGRDAVALEVAGHTCESRDGRYEASFTRPAGDWPWTLRARDLAGNSASLPLDLLLVDPGGRGSHKTLGSALRSAVPGSSVLVADGRYRECLDLEQAVEFVALRRGKVELASEGETVINVRGGDVRIEGFRFTQQGLDKAPLLRVQRGRLAITGAGIESRGSASGVPILVEGPGRASGGPPPALELRRTRLRLYGGSPTAIHCRNGALTLDDVQLDLSDALPGDDNEDDAGALRLESGSLAEVRLLRILTRRSGIQMRESQLIGEGLTLEGAPDGKAGGKKSSGIYAQRGFVELRRILISGFRNYGVGLEGAITARLATGAIRACGERQKHGGIKVREGAVVLAEGVTFENNEGYGVSVDRRSMGLFERCVFRTNKGEPVEVDKRGRVSLHACDVRFGVISMKVKDKESLLFGLDCVFEAEGDGVALIEIKDGGRLQLESCASRSVGIQCDDESTQQVDWLPSVAEARKRRRSEPLEYVVDGAGRGDFLSIEEAFLTISRRRVVGPPIRLRLRPGVYTCGLAMGGGVATLIGDGKPEEVVLELNAEAEARRVREGGRPSRNTRLVSGQGGFLVLRNLTFRKPPPTTRQAALKLSFTGLWRLEDCVIELPDSMGISIEGAYRRMADRIDPDRAARDRFPRPMVIVERTTIRGGDRGALRINDAILKLIDCRLVDVGSRETDLDRALVLARKGSLVTIDGGSIEGAPVSGLVVEGSRIQLRGTEIRNCGRAGRGRRSDILRLDPESRGAKADALKWELDRESRRVVVKLRPGASRSSEGSEDDTSEPGRGARKP